MLITAHRLADGMNQKMALLSYFVMSGQAYRLRRFNCLCSTERLRFFFKFHRRHSQARVITYFKNSIYLCYLEARAQMYAGWNNNTQKL